MTSNVVFWRELKKLIRPWIGGSEFARVCLDELQVELGPDFIWNSHFQGVSVPKFTFSLS